jgi:hypothetical protein
MEWAEERDGFFRAAGGIVTEFPHGDIKAGAFRIGLVLCLLSVPLGVVLIPAALMASDAGDIQNPALITFAFAAMIYPLAALVCGVVAWRMRRRVKGARPWVCLALPAVNIAAGFVALVAI